MLLSRRRSDAREAHRLRARCVHAWHRSRRDRLRDARTDVGNEDDLRRTTEHRLHQADVYQRPTRQRRADRTNCAARDCRPALHHIIVHVTRIEPCGRALTPRRSEKRHSRRQTSDRDFSLKQARNAISKRRAHRRARSLDDPRWCVRTAATKRSRAATFKQRFPAKSSPRRGSIKICPSLEITKRASRFRDGNDFRRARYSGWS